MRKHGNLADPAYEPTDEELAGLMREAFAGIAEQRRQDLERLRAEIARASADTLERLQGRRPL